MAKKKNRPRLKKRTREHVIADLSVNFVERQALLCSYSVERIVHDYGIDLILFSYNDEGEVEPGELLLQLKAKNQPRILTDGKHLSFKIETADLQHWLRQPMPVILVVFDAVKEVGYWLYVQAYCQRKKLVPDPAKKETVVRIPLENQVNPAAMKRFARFKEKIAAQREGITHEES